jgi:hypothetical protein
MTPNFNIAHSFLVRFVILYGIILFRGLFCLGCCMLHICTSVGLPSQEHFSAVIFLCSVCLCNFYQNLQRPADSGGLWELALKIGQMAVSGRATQHISKYGHTYTWIEVPKYQLQLMLLGGKQLHFVVQANTSSRSIHSRRSKIFVSRVRVVIKRRWQQGRPTGR